MTPCGRPWATPRGAGCSTCCSSRGTAQATSLSEQLPVSRQAVAKHLTVLDRVGLVHGAAAGRERRYRVDDAQFAEPLGQLASVVTEWDGRLRRIARSPSASNGSSNRDGARDRHHPPGRWCARVSSAPGTSS